MASAEVNAPTRPSPTGTPQGLVRGIEVWLAISAILLLSVTYRLWFPTLSADSFPAIPCFEFLCSCPQQVDWCLSIALIIGWCLSLAGWQRIGFGTSLCTGLLLVALNQHRLQPWHYQFLLFAAVILLVNKRARLQALRWIVVSVYLFSALSKFDYEFVHTVGQQFLDVALRLVGLDDTFSPRSRFALILALPLTELLIGLALMWRPARRWAGLAACTMHLLLLVLLSPLGLNHSPGVILWNIHFLGLSLLLFVLPSPSNYEPDSGEQSHGPIKAVKLYPSLLLLFPALIMPTFERIGWWDHWPSWAVYAPHSSRTEVFVAQTELSRLPPSLFDLIEQDDADDEIKLFARAPVAQWSLETLGVPIYPQARFQLGVTRFLASRFNEFEIRAELLSAASRFNGNREMEELRGSSAFARAQDRFFFCTRPRDASK